MLPNTLQATNGSSVPLWTQRRVGKYTVEVTDGNLRKVRTPIKGKERPTDERDRENVRACSREDELYGVAGLQITHEESLETWARKLH